MGPGLFWCLTSQTRFSVISIRIKQPVLLCSLICLQLSTWRTILFHLFLLSNRLQLFRIIVVYQSMLGRASRINTGNNVVQQHCNTISDMKNYGNNSNRCHLQRTLFWTHLRLIRMWSSLRQLCMWSDLTLSWPMTPMTPAYFTYSHIADKEMSKHFKLYIISPLLNILC